MKSLNDNQIISMQRMEIRFDLPSMDVMDGEVVFTPKALFERDHYTCLLCGARQSPKHLAVLHLKSIPAGQTGQWEQAVTACQPCADKVKGRVETESLLAVPYRPKRHEYRILSRRSVLTDLMMCLHRKRQNTKEKLDSSCGLASVISKHAIKIFETNLSQPITEGGYCGYS